MIAAAEVVSSFEQPEILDDNSSRFDYADNLFEQVEEDLDGNRERFDDIMIELCDTGFLECCVSVTDDLVIYKARVGLNWSSVVELSDPIKKKILLQVIKNPKCFFVLFNTQKGKLRIIGKEIASWSTTYKKRPVSFIVVDNDKTLSEQSANGLFSCFPIRKGHETSTKIEEKYDVRIFELSSNNRISLNDIITYIDAYAYNETYAIPLIVVLANNKQIEKLLRILHHVIHHPSENLCAGGAWDEADKTYPQFRDKPFSIHGHMTSFRQLLNDPKERIIRNGFVTATEGELLEEEYEECSNAFHYPIVMDPEDEANYMAFHHPESEKHNISIRGRESNNVIAERIIRENWDEHFNKPFTLRDGTLYHHKIIINSNPRADEMRDFALVHRKYANVITFNMRGLRLYRETGEPLVYQTRKQNLNRLLFYIYKMRHLEDRPLIIIGRRKIDRGLGFHYAPRKNGPRVYEIDGKDGVLITDGYEGLIWTDIIMGNRIEHIPTAVQKAGRGAGIIRQCPQYPGEFHYWIDADTAANVERHYVKVDKVNKLRGTNSMLQAVTHAESLIPTVRKRNHNVDLTIFRVIYASTPSETLRIMKEITEDIFDESFRTPHRDETGKYKTSLNNTSSVVQLLDAVKKVPGAYGTNNGTRTYRRFFACYKDVTNENTLCCVIPLIDPSYTDEMKNALDSTYETYLLNVPQEGDM